MIADREQSQISTVLSKAVEAAANSAGMKVLSFQTGTDLRGLSTTCFTFGLSGDAVDRTLQLELSHDFDFQKPALLPEMTRYLQEAAIRLRSPRPDCYVTLAGLPVRFDGFAWPFHRSTSGADTYLVHGIASLEDGTGSPLHAKISASMTVTFAEIVPAPEQPYSETFIYNAIRKTLDQGQIEMLKSGNRQPVMVTTRYYSRWQKKFVFSETDEKVRKEFLALKLYWLSGVLGQGQPIWIADPRDEQYLNCSGEELKQASDALIQDGLAQLDADGQFASPTSRLMDCAEHYQSKLTEALALTKPAFNEEMRHGHTNM